MDNQLEQHDHAILQEADRCFSSCHKSLLLMQIPAVVSARAQTLSTGEPHQRDHSLLWNTRYIRSLWYAMSDLQRSSMEKWYLDAKSLTRDEQ